jgi:hypothetical protein
MRMKEVMMMQPQIPKKLQSKMRMKEVMMMQPQILISLALNQKKEISIIQVIMQNSKDNILLVM